MKYFDELCLKEHSKDGGRVLNQMGNKTILNLDYANDLSILDENISKMNIVLIVLIAERVSAVNMIKVEWPGPDDSFTVEKVRKNREISLRANFRILQPKVLKVVKCGHSKRRRKICQMFWR